MQIAIRAPPSRAMRTIPCPTGAAGVAHCSSGGPPPLVPRCAHSIERHRPKDQCFLPRLGISELDFPERVGLAGATHIDALSKLRWAMHCDYVISLVSRIVILSNAFQDGIIMNYHVMRMFFCLSLSLYIYIHFDFHNLWIMYVLCMRLFLFVSN